VLIGCNRNSLLIIKHSFSQCTSCWNASWVTHRNGYRCTIPMWEIRWFWHTFLLGFKVCFAKRHSTHEYKHFSKVSYMFPKQRAAFLTYAVIRVIFLWPDLLFCKLCCRSPCGEADMRSTCTSCQMGQTICSTLSQSPCTLCLQICKMQFNCSLSLSSRHLG
jgi:hypothetical protein